MIYIQIYEMNLLWQVINFTTDILMGTGLSLQDCLVGTKCVGNTGNAGYGNQPTVLLSGYQMWWGIPQNYNTEICGPYIVGAMLRKYKALCTLYIYIYIFILNTPYT